MCLYTKSQRQSNYGLHTSDAAPVSYTHLDVYKRQVYECCKASTILKISVQENLNWQTVNEICQRGARKEIGDRPLVKVRIVGMLSLIHI